MPKYAISLTLTHEAAEFFTTYGGGNRSKGVEKAFEALRERDTTDDSYGPMENLSTSDRVRYRRSWIQVRGMLSDKSWGSKLAECDDVDQLTAWGKGIEWAQSRPSEYLPAALQTLLQVLNRRTYKVARAEMLKPLLGVDIAKRGADIAGTWVSQVDDALQPIKPDDLLNDPLTETVAERDARLERVRTAYDRAATNAERKRIDPLAD